MVEIRLEPADGIGAMAKDVYVSVRVGETQKLSKFTGARVYRFPDGAAGQRTGSIEVFQRLGQGNVDVDPSSEQAREVKIACGAELLAFRVHLENVVAPSKEQIAEERSVKKEVKKKSAKEYLNKHGIEARLTEAMSNVLRERPEDPAAFIAEELLRGRSQGAAVTSLRGAALQPAARPSDPTEAPAPTAAEPATATAAGDAAVATGTTEDAAAAAASASDSALPPFVGSSLGAPAPKASESPAPTMPDPAAEPISAPPRETEAERAFQLQPSVGTWLAKPPRALGPGLMATRSLQGFGPAGDMPLAERCEVERILTKSFSQLRGKLSGDYLPLPSSVSYPPRPGGMSTSDQGALQQAGLSFSASDPNGRGIFLMKDRRAAIMVNSMEQHVTLVTLPQASIELHSLDSALCEAMKQDGQQLL